MPDFEQIHPGHGHFPSKRQTTVCPPGKAYYVCPAGPFKGCCSSDPCTTGWCKDYPHDPAWQGSTATESVTQTSTQTQTAIGSYTTTVTMTLSSVTPGGIVTSTLSESVSDSPLISSIISEISAISSLTSSRSESTLTPKSSSNHFTSSAHSTSSTSPFLSINTSTRQKGSPSTFHGGTVAGIALGTAGAIALFLLLCCVCIRRRKKNAVEDKELKRQLKEAAAIQVERNKALRALENRRTGVGSEGAWVSSPRHSTGFPGLRREG